MYPDEYHDPRELSRCMSETAGRDLDTWNAARRMLGLPTVIEDVPNADQDAARQTDAELPVERPVSACVDTGKAAMLRIPQQPGERVTAVPMAAPKLPTHERQRRVLVAAGLPWPNAGRKYPSIGRLIVWLGLSGRGADFTAEETAKMREAWATARDRAFANANA
ncbi:hypothetical protein [Spirillospora sp. NPDC029432]|uniref:hypothetical protein n=1 Tax=Spirillospora sp. NPDC029432 TaxID=3154599 RepID=UPI003454684A